MFNLSLLAQIAKVPQGRQDSVVPGINWISGIVLNHGISTGSSACVLEHGESNLHFLESEEKMQRLVSLVQNNKVVWRHPEETALLHIMCLHERGEDVMDLVRLVVSLEKEKRIRFFPREGVSKVFDRYAPVSKITCRELKMKVENRIERGVKYVDNLETILQNYLGRTKTSDYIVRTLTNPEALCEGDRLINRIVDTRDYICTLRQALDLIDGNADRGLTKDEFDRLTAITPLPCFKCALQCSLKDLDLNVEDWAQRVADYVGIAGSPPIQQATPFEQKLSDALFFLAESVTKAFLVGTDHSRLTRTSFPWHFAAEPNWSERGGVRARVREILSWFVEKYPGHPLPNPLVQSIHALLKSTGDTKEIIPLKTIAEDLFRWGNCPLGPRYHYAAMKAYPLLSGGYYAGVYGIGKDTLSIVKRGIDVCRVREIENQIKAVDGKIEDIRKDVLWHLKPPSIANYETYKKECRDLNDLLTNVKSPLTRAAGLLVSSPGRLGASSSSQGAQASSESMLNAVYVLTVPLLPAIRLGAISDYEAYARGAWRNIVRNYRSDQRTIRRLEPMIANLHVALSFVSYREKLIAEFQVENPDVWVVVFA